MIVAFLLAALPGQVSAQTPADRASLNPTATASDTADRDPPSTALMVGGGILAGGVGAVGGTYLGAGIVDDTCEGEGCFVGIIQGAFIGAVVAESVLLPLGVHVAAGGEGDYGTSLLASAGLGAAAVGLAYATNMEGPGVGVVMAIPVAQLLISIAEHR